MIDMKIKTIPIMDIALKGIFEKLVIAFIANGKSLL